MGLFCYVYPSTDRFTILISDSFEYNHSPTYAVVTFRKVRRKSNFAQVGRTRGQLYMYIQESPVEIHIAAHWNLIGHSMTALPPVLSSNSILRLSSSHCAFISAGENFGTRLTNILILF